MTMETCKHISFTKPAALGHIVVKLSQLSSYMAASRARLEYTPESQDELSYRDLIEPVIVAKLEMILAGVS